MNTRSLFRVLALLVLPVRPAGADTLCFQPQPA